MARSKIEWLKNPDGSQGYSINPVKGLCPMDCKDLEGKPYCYARKLYRRFKWNPEIRFDETVLTQALYKTKVGDKIFVGSTMELFGDWIKFDWLLRIIEYTMMYPSRTFIFLTKQPQNLPIKFPPNCWVLVSATDQHQYLTGLCYLRQIEATVRGFSFEPLLHKINTSYDTLDWNILGSQTQPVKHPPLEWVNLILQYAREFETPVFVKSPMAEYFGINRKEFPVSTGLRGNCERTDKMRNENGH